MRFLVGQAHEHDIARLALDESGNEGAPRAYQQIAFPVGGQRAIRDLGWPLTNRDGIDNLALCGTDATAGARVSKVAPPAELLAQSASEHRDSE